MPPVLTADTMEVICQGRVDNQVTLNTLWFQKVGGAITPGDVQAVTVAVGGWFSGILAPLLSEDWHTETVKGQDWSVGAGAVFEGSVTGVGGVGSEAAPNNVAAVVSFSGGSSGRFARGRNFVPALPNSLIVLNTIDTALIDDLVGGYAQLLPSGSVDLSGFAWVVNSRFFGVDVDGKPIPRAAGLTTQISSVVMKTPFVKSMRTREVGKGK